MESPRVFLEIVDQIRTNILDQNTIIEHVDAHLETLLNKFGKANSVRELEDLLMR